MLVNLQLLGSYHALILQSASFVSWLNFVAHILQRYVSRMARAAKLQKV